ncbi:MAG: endonuclease/exonuclease/phosphatase family protein, partial [Candidatus Thiodiazotropha sp.]
MQREELSVWYTNACSLRGKWGEVVLQSQGKDVVAITETWLKPNYLVAAELLETHALYRQDRSDGRKGGGALILLSRKFDQWESGVAVNTPNIQATACHFKAGCVKTGIFCVYRAPVSSKDEDDALMCAMQEFIASTVRFVIIGDFNLPDINWDLETTRRGQMAETFLDWMHAHALHQHVKSPTRYRHPQVPSLIDLVITRYQRDVQQLNIEDPVAGSDHCALNIRIPTRYVKPIGKPRRFYGKMDTAQLISKAASFRWIPEVATPSVEQRWLAIKEGILRLTNEFAPLTQPKKKRRPVWWQPKIERKIKRRRKLWLEYRQAQTTAAWEKYRVARNETQQAQRSAKLRYENNIARKAKSNPKAFYAYIQASKNVRESVGSIEMEGGRVMATEDSQKAQTLMSFFQSVYRPPLELSREKLSALSERETKFSMISITENDVFAQINSLDRHKSAGPDELHPAVVQPLADILKK